MVVTDPINRVPTVFYSWQADRPNATNRGFIAGALEKALEANKMTGEQSLRADAATQNEPGSPNIPSAIFTKIASSAVFVGDVTIVQSWPTRGRRAPNPNVMIELGFAVHCLGWRRIIMVMNEHYGRANHLPFHLQQHLYPLTYCLRSSSPTKAEERSKLIKALSAKIAQITEHDHLQVGRILQQLDNRCASFLYEAKRIQMPHFAANVTAPEVIQRLLETGVVYLNLGKNQTYAYEWTFLGAMVRDECYRRAQAAVVPPAAAAPVPPQASA